jgi:hypothetical protein
MTLSISAARQRRCKSNSDVRPSAYLAPESLLSRVAESETPETLGIPAMIVHKLLVRRSARFGACPSFT